MANLITASTGSPHITPRMDAHWHMEFFGTASFISEGSFVPTMYQNRIIRIAEGVGSLQGRIFEVPKGTYDQIQLDNTGSSKRIDIICFKIIQSSNGTQSGEWIVIKGTSTSGTPNPPTVPSYDLDGGQNVAYIPVIQAQLSNNQLTSVETVAPILSGVGKYTTGADRVIKKASLTIAYSLPANGTGYVDQSLPNPFQGYTVLPGCYYTNKQNIVIANNGWELGDTSAKRIYFKNLSSNTIQFEVIANLIFIKSEMISED